MRVASLISAAVGTHRANYKVVWTPLWIPPVSPTTAFFLFNGVAGVVHTAPRVTLSSDSYCSWKLKGMEIWPFLFNFVNWIISIGITCLSSFCTTSLSLRRIPWSLLMAAQLVEQKPRMKKKRRRGVLLVILSEGLCLRLSQWNWEVQTSYQLLITCHEFTVTFLFGNYA